MAGEVSLLCSIIRYVLGVVLSGWLYVGQDVMVVGEPSLMGGEFGDEDERLITRLENSQYDTTVVDDQSSQLQPTSAVSNAPQPGGPTSQPPANNPPQPPSQSNQSGGPNSGTPASGPPSSHHPPSGGGPQGGPFTSSPHHMGAAPGWPDPSRGPSQGPNDPDKKSPAMN